MGKVVMKLFKICLVIEEFEFLFQDRIFSVLRLNFVCDLEFSA